MREIDWTPAQTDQLMKLYFSTPKPTIDVMAAAVGKSPMATWIRISRLGAATPGAKLRTCLGPVCQGQRSFYSEHAGNRICQGCDQSEMMRCA